ncbi:hypothetical protein BX666DRAFT_1935453 [Dichotomocladium elegans]|nr:hypothetical protein BX666DRAFT_1935453 [Dichotomocladium elegans]
MGRDGYNVRILGQALYDKVASSRILLVGAGGIGCELLKNLVLSGFKHIKVIDLDTIDISNLNRQFLFQRQHVKKSKAHVAKESALRFNPDVDIESFQANIMDPELNVAWFSKFDLVFNALDNLEARRHVNQMCLIARVPLVESGTTGYLGQAYVIQKDVTECFDCQPKATPKTYPICTIRSTPSQPIHCIVWAKSYLFNQLYGNAEEEEEEPQESDKENVEELAALARETEELKKIKLSMGTDAYPRQVFKKVFTTDIQRLLSMEDMWKNRDRKPIPLQYDVLEAALAERSENTESSQSGSEIKDQKLWDLNKCFEVFNDSVIRLSKRAMSEGILSFDKDDDDAMDFVTATANLRAHVFGIPQKTRFEVKSMAGNIIPAIATTNAIIAGVAVMKGFAVLRGDVGSIKRTYLKTVSRRPYLLLPETSSRPNPDCDVCSASNARVVVDVDQAKLSDIINTIVVGKMGMDVEGVSIMDKNRLIYDMDLEENLKLPLSQLLIRDGTILRVISDEDGQIDLVIQAKSGTSGVELVDEPLPVKKVTKPHNGDAVHAGQKRQQEIDDGDNDMLTGCAFSSLLARSERRRNLKCHVASGVELGNSYISGLQNYSTARKESICSYLEEERPVVAS